MAEMTASEAVEVLHNNQYQKHIGNGEYDYIHPLTDAEAKGVESRPARARGLKRGG